MTPVQWAMRQVARHVADMAGKEQLAKKAKAKGRGS